MPEAQNNETIHPATEVVGATMLAMLDQSMVAQIALMLKVPVPASDIMNLLIEHTAKLLALVEPMQLRNEILGEIRRNLPAVLNRHVEARRTTQGGILMAGPADMPGRPN